MHNWDTMSLMTQGYPGIFGKDTPPNKLYSAICLAAPTFSWAENLCLLLPSLFYDMVFLVA